MADGGQGGVVQPPEVSARLRPQLERLVCFVCTVLGLHVRKNQGLIILKLQAQLAGQSDKWAAVAAGSSADHWLGSGASLQLLSHAARDRMRLR
jgi:hypothetical protein